MAVKLAIADTIGVKVEGNTVDESGGDKPFKFVLVCNRLSQEKLRDEIANKDATSIDFFKRHALGWRDQRLVTDDAGNPAPFSLEALELLFSISGMAGVCWSAYLAQVVATGKN